MEDALKREMPQKQFYTLPEVAVILGFSYEAAYLMARKNAFPVVKIGGRFRVPIHAFNKWIEEQSAVKA